MLAVVVSTKSCNFFFFLHCWCQCDVRIKMVVLQNLRIRLQDCSFEQNRTRLTSQKRLAWRFSGSDGTRLFQCYRCVLSLLFPMLAAERKRLCALSGFVAEHACTLSTPARMASAWLFILICTKYCLSYSWASMNEHRYSKDGRDGFFLLLVTRPL